MDVIYYTLSSGSGRGPGSSSHDGAQDAVSNGSSGMKVVEHQSDPKKGHLDLHFNVGGKNRMLTSVPRLTQKTLKLLRR